MKPALILATLALLGGATGCTGGAPTDAAAADFCDSYNSLFTDMARLRDASEQEVIATIKAWGARMEETGTPEDISEEARAGFEETVAMIGDLEAGASQEDFDKIEQDLTDEQKQQVDEFDKYTNDTCGSPADQLAPQEQQSPAEPSQ